MGFSKSKLVVHGFEMSLEMMSEGVEGVEEGLEGLGQLGAAQLPGRHREAVRTFSVRLYTGQPLQVTFAAHHLKSCRTGQSTVSTSLLTVLLFLHFFHTSFTPTLLSHLQKSHYPRE